jgi:hypothetical protein
VYRFLGFGRHSSKIFLPHHTSNFKILRFGKETLFSLLSI